MLSSWHGTTIVLTGTVPLSWAGTTPYILIDTPLWGRVVLIHVSLWYPLPNSHVVLVSSFSLVWCSLADIVPLHLLEGIALLAALVHWDVPLVKRVDSMWNYVTSLSRTNRTVSLHCVELCYLIQCVDKCHFSVWYDVTSQCMTMSLHCMGQCHFHCVIQCHFANAMWNDKMSPCRKLSLLPDTISHPNLEQHHFTVWPNVTVTQHCLISQHCTFPMWHNVPMWSSITSPSY